MLKRELTYNDLLFIAIGNIIGGGIFSLMGRSIKYGGGITWIYLIITGFSMLFMSQAYTDLMDKITDNKSEYLIAKDFAGDKFASLYSLIATITSASTASVIALAFSEHINKLMIVNNMSSINNTYISILTLFIIMSINIIGIRESTTIINSMTIIESVSLLLLISFLPFKFNTGELSSLPKSLSKSILVPLIIIFAFTGAETLPRLAGESINPKEDIPRAITNSISITSVMYALVSMVMISVLGLSGISNSTTPVLDTYKQIFGSKITGAITIVALFSIFNTIMTSNLSSSRSLYGISLEKEIPYLKYVNDKTKTPITSIIVATIISIVIILSTKSIEKMAIFSNLFIMIIMIVINGAAYKYNINNKDDNSYKRHRNIASIVLASLFIGFGSIQLLK